MPRTLPVLIPPADSVEELRRSLQGSLNRLIDSLNKGENVNNVDMREHRIRNLSWPAELHDAVNVEYLEAALVQKKKKSAAAAVTLGSGGSVTSYDPVLSFYARFGLENIVISGNAKHLHVVIAAVDETKVDKLYGVVAADMNNTTDPITITPTITAATGYAFAVNDFVVFDDPAQDAGNTSYRSYEVAKITNIAGADYTFSRAAFDSYKSAHSAGVAFYPAKLHYFGIPADKVTYPLNGFPKQVYFDLASSAIVGSAVAVGDIGGLGSWNVKNWSRLFYPFPGEPSQSNPAPGARTLNGAQYLAQLSGALTQGQSLGARLWVGEDASIRDIVVTIAVPPAGNNAVYNGILANFSNVADVFYVLYIEPGLDTTRRVGVVDQLAIRENEYASFIDPSNMPAYRRMPYIPKWPFKFPVIGTVGSIYDPATGLLATGALPFTAQNDYIYLKESGELDVVVAKIGTSAAGINAEISVMT